MLSRRRTLSAFAAFVGAASLARVRAAGAALTRVRVGIMSGEDEDVWRVVAANARKSGLNVEVVTFSDYNLPDEALSEHELDANAFQHGPFLKAQVEAHGFHITPVGDMYVSPIGLYSSKWSSVAALPKGATIGVPNDPSNEGRALLLLQAQGLIKVSPSAGLLPTTLDITENPRDLNVKELDAGVVGRALSDLDAAVVNTDWAQKAGIDVVHQRIAQEALQHNAYTNFIAVNDENVHAPWVEPLVAAYQQQNVRQALLDVYHGATLPAWQ
ncbi:MetQ/NlpA family ABC transporter substrate-binding protein [Neokomagataea thailandica]|uniref:Lipoprotein n=1 Tax=Neokomagataea tanensis NBRC 106556 TaxID=1223519 RepID=A0ABQ0QK15_9PROT|nr:MULTISPECIES: MetQ/NlpA family ABC transporter substrate-binding protein [Neokomagataea]GBR47594.1 D-methionine transporter substrate-binding periplasmic protein [Neokomagataea tanensis NBRC 106556]